MIAAAMMTIQVRGPGWAPCAAHAVLYRRREAQTHQRQAATQAAQLSSERHQLASARESASTAQQQTQQVLARTSWPKSPATFELDG